MKKEEENQIYQLSAKDYSKSNFLIGSKYKSTLMEAKLTALCLSQIKYDGKKVYSLIQGREIKKIFGSKSHAFYSQLDKTAQSMTGRSIGMSDPEKQQFMYLAVIITAVYKNGELYVEYNPTLKDYIVNIKSNFTRLSLPIMMKFTTVYGFRLYEVIKSRLYKENPITIQLSELKFLLGVANAELDSVKKILNGQLYPDYDKALSLSPEKTYSDYNSFRKYVIDKAIEDINDKTDIDITYKANYKGVGGKAYSISFYITYKNEDKNEKVEKELSEEEKMDFIFDIADNLFEEKLKMKDYQKIAEVANYNKEKIENAYSVMKQSKTQIDNITGWLIKAIEEGYENLPANNDSGQKTKNSFNNFEQQSFDVDMSLLEEQLVIN